MKPFTARRVGMAPALVGSATPGSDQAENGITGGGYEECHDLLGLAWRKSSFSGPPEQNCLEIARTGDGRVAVRDSKSPAGAVLLFTRAEWTAFVNGVYVGEFNLDS